MVSRVTTAVYAGIEGYRVTVETDTAAGLPYTNIVGLASTMIMEAKERVKSAIQNSGFEYPMRRLTINLTPGALRKTGTHFDLPIAIGILASAHMIKYPVSACDEMAFIGELTLTGQVLPVEGVLPMVMSLRMSGIKTVIIPASNVREASLVDGIEIVGVDSLLECVDCLRGVKKDGIYDHLEKNLINVEEELDFADIRGQENAKRAITIAAAGEHGLIMIGNPGCGKTMLSRRIPSILPEMSREEIIETTIIYSVVGEIDANRGIVNKRPFRMPHHSIGKASLIGGGNYPVPGEITLAHNGVLFLDEANEFDRNTIEALRVPLEDRKITISRRGKSYTFPSRFLLVMAANPCKCGYYGDPDHECKCTMRDIEMYKRKLSGPLLERIDMQIQMQKVSYEQISRSSQEKISSESMRHEVARAREFALREGRMVTNSKLTDEEINNCMFFGTTEKNFLKDAYAKLSLSPRTYMKVLRVARTIADMDESHEVTIEHLSEALMYRSAIDKIHA